MSSKNWGEKIPVQSEKALHAAVARYIRLQYPDVIFFTDSGSGAYFKGPQGALTKARQTELNSVDRAGNPDRCPDMFIAKPSGRFHGLYLEIKREGTRLKKKDGAWASAHLEEQAATLRRLRLAGYYACFAVGWDDVINRIDNYICYGY